MNRRNFLRQTSMLIAASAFGENSFGKLTAPQNLRLNAAIAPAWFTNLSHKQWGAPVQNWLGDINVVDPLAGANAGTTGHKAIIGAWTGMGADQTRNTIWMAGNGGHADYAGNEVYACDLRTATPKWIRQKNASRAPTNDGRVWTRFDDGTPPSDHTGNYQVEADGRWFKVGLGSPNWLGSPGHRWWEFNPATNAWIDRGTALQSDYYAITGMGLYDRVDRQLIKIFASRDYAVQFVNIDTMAITLSTGAFNNSSSNSYGDIDTTHRKLVWAYTDKPNELCVLDLNNKSAGYVILPVTGSGPGLTTYQIHWHAPSQAFITWDGASGLKKLTPILDGTGKYTSAVWSSVAGAGGPTPVRDHSLLYNKIQMIKDMGNGDSALVVVSRYGNPDTYVMRLAGPV
jgi:hypothetical protein